MKKDELQKLIKIDNGWAIGVLVAIYNNQELDEQAGHQTIHQNSIGFNSVDAGFMTSITSNYLKWGQLSERQMVFVRKNMVKYAGQALDSNIQKVEVEVIGDKIKTAGAKTEPKRERVIQAVDLDKQKLIIRFSYPRGDDRFQNTLDFVKSLESRKFDSVSKNWSCPASLENIGLLRTFGFNLSESVIKWESDNQYLELNFKDLLDFSLCPLYKGLGKNLTEKEINHAEWSIPKNKKSIDSSKDKSFKRQITGSKKKSSKNIKGNSAKSRMEEKSFRSNKRSDEHAKDTNKTSCGAKKSQRKTWCEFQGRQWTGIDGNCEISRQSFFSMWLHKGISNPNETCEECFQKCRNCLQSRLRKPKTKDSNRIRRSCSPINGTEKNRQKENKNITSPWLECNTFRTLQTILIVPGLPKGSALRPYQIQGVRYIESRHGRALCGDEQGLGKTVEALVWLHRHPEARPAIIACPASLKLNWEKETRKWLPNEPVYVLSGRWSKTKHVPTDGIIIINYDILPGKYKKVMDPKDQKMKERKIPNTGWADALAKKKPQSITFDEIQYIKDIKNHRGKTCKALAKKIPNVLGLSGTPIENRPKEFFNPISIIDPTIFPSFWNYAQEYCGAKHNGFGWDFTGATNIKQLHEKLKKSVMIRRLKKDVLPELPPKNRMVVTLNLDNRKEYNKASGDIISYIRDTKGEEAAEKAEKAQGLVTIETLKQLAIKGKISACIEWIERYLENNDKLVVGCVHTNIVEQLVEHFDEIAVCIYGSTPLKKRHENVTAFQEDPNVKLMIGNVKAAGVGLTLTAANATATIEFEWKPAIHSQFEDRVHRIGQEADSVFAYYLVAQNTIEEDIAALLDEKMKVLNQVLEGEKVDDESLLTELLKRLKEK